MHNNILRNFQNLHFYVPLGHHITLKSELEEGITIERKYTPTFKSIKLPDNEKAYKAMDDGNIHLIIKTYEKGAFTPFLSRLPLGLFYDYFKQILIFKNFYTINIHLLYNYEKSYFCRIKNANGQLS